MTEHARAAHVLVLLSIKLRRDVGVCVCTVHSSPHPSNSLASIATTSIDVRTVAGDAGGSVGAEGWDDADGSVGAEGPVVVVG